MSWAFTAIAIGSVVTGVAGYAQGQAAKATANANADIDEREARQSLMVSQVQEQLAQRQAEVQHQMELSQAAAAEANAENIRQESLAMNARSEENIRRKQTEGARLGAAQRAIYAGAGVIDSTGTPLAVLAAQAAATENSVQDEHYMANTNYGSKQFDASIESYKAKVGASVADANYAIGIEGSKLRGVAALISSRNKLDQASINRAAGAAAARNATIGAVGSLISGVGGAFSSAGHLATGATITGVVHG